MCWSFATEYIIRCANASVTPATSCLPAGGTGKGLFTRVDTRCPSYNIEEGVTDLSGFVQTPPQLGNQFRDDRVLRGYLVRVLPEQALASAAPALERMGALAGGELYAQQLAERGLEPVLEQWDAWGNRVDRVALTPLWRRAEEIAAREGLVALAYEAPLGRHSRVLQLALAYLFTPSTDVYACPLAMTDGAARTLLASGNRALIERALPRLTSRDPARFWTSGQWMTEAIGGSDVGLRRDRRALDAGRGMAAVRAQVVHFRDHLADGTHPRAAGGRSPRRQGPRDVLRRDARRARAAPIASASTA